MADKTRYAWFGTCHLWQYWDTISVESSRTGASTFQGVARERQGGSSGSPNFERIVKVRCKVGPTSDSGGTPGGEIAELQILDTEAALFALGKTQATLKFTYDYNGGAGSVAFQFASCEFVGRTDDPPDYASPHYRIVTYTFRVFGALTINASLSSFRVASL